MRKLATSLPTLLWVLILLNSPPVDAQRSPCENADGIPIYSPCGCVVNTEDNSANVTCFSVSNQDIRNVFKDSVTPKINQFSLVPLAGQTQLLIEADLLYGKQAKIINIASCTSNALVTALEIDPGAFIASSGYTQEFSITDCDIDRVDFRFLQNFNQLIDVRLTKVTNIRSIATLPFLAMIDSLSIVESGGFQNPLFIFPAPTLVSLNNLVLKENADIDNKVANKILSSVATNGVNLTQLTLIDSPLVTQVPDNIVDIPTLNSIDLSFNSITTIGTNTFNFLDYRLVRKIDVSNNMLATVSDNAFTQGDYGNAIIRLDNNRLTRFKHEVYLEVLDEMNNQSEGDGVNQQGISYIGNTVICTGCDLAWLIRDNPELLRFVSGGTCVDGTSFENLSPSDYGGNCAVITPTPVITSTTESSRSSMEVTTDNATTIVTESTNQPTTEVTTAELTTTITTTTTASTTTTTTTTTKEQNLTTPSVPSTTPSDGTSNETNKLFIYITIGLVGIILLVLIIGLIFLACTRKSSRKRMESSSSASSKGQDRPAAPTTANYGISSWESQSAIIPAGQRIPRPQPVVQGPGGSWYAQTYGDGLNNEATSQNNRVIAGPNYYPKPSTKRVAY